VSREDMEFTKVLNECVCEGLRLALGEDIKKVVLFYIDLAPFNTEKDIHRRLYSIFLEGATILEKIVVKELFRRLNVPYTERGDFDFELYVEKARDFFRSQRGMIIEQGKRSIRQATVIRS